MTNLRQVSRNSKEVQYADPDTREDTVTVKASVQPKKAGALTVHNVNSGVNILRTAALPSPVGCDDKCAPLNLEKLSGRVSFSGSTKSKAEMLKLWTDLKSITDASFADLSAGFLPATETVVTVA